MTKIIFAFLFIMAGCSSEIRVSSDHDPDYDLKKYRTFDWLKITNIELEKNPLYYNELNDKRIKSAVQEHLKRKGYLLSEEHPDLIVHYHIIVDDRSVVTTDPFGYFYSPFWTHLQTTVRQYREGTLIVDIMESKTNNLIWRGWAASPIDEVYTSEKIESLVKTAVAIIRDGPPVSDDSAMNLKHFLS